MGLVCELIFGRMTRCMSITTDKTWNDLPLDIRLAKTVDIFISKLKTHFFQIVYE